MKRILIALAIAGALLGASGLIAAKDKPARGKFLVILQAGKESHEGMARAVVFAGTEGARARRGAGVRRRGHGMD